MTFDEWLKTKPRDFARYAIGPQYLAVPIPIGIDDLKPMLEACWAAAAEEEREACAKIVENACAWAGGHGESCTPSGYELARLIRGQNDRL